MWVCPGKIDVVAHEFGKKKSLIFCIRKHRGFVTLSMAPREQSKPRDPPFVDLTCFDLSQDGIGDHRLLSPFRHAGIAPLPGSAMRVGR